MTETIDPYEDTHDRTGHFLAQQTTQDALQNNCAECGRGPREVGHVHVRTCSSWQPHPASITADKTRNQ